MWTDGIYNIHGGKIDLNKEEGQLIFWHKKKSR